MSHDVEAFLGAWSLQSWTITYKDGRVIYPFGEDAYGLLVYTADGAMTGAIARRERAGFGRPDIRSAPESERAAAFNSYFHYAGRWELQGDSIHHHVFMALNPDFVGSVQIRQAQFEGDQLTLSAIEEGRDRRHALIWRRGLPV